MERDPEQHSLSSGELQTIYETEVAPRLFNEARSVEHPTAILVGGQPGAGKTPLVIAAAHEFAHQGGLVRIVGDDLRRHLPKYWELQLADDTTAAFYTDRDSGRLVEMALRDAASRRTNVLVEGTLRNPEVVARTLTDLRAAGFSTELRVLAVQPELSSLGILQRYALQKESRGTGRMTTPAAHAAALSGIPRSLDRVQDERLADRLLILGRGGALLQRMELGHASSPPAERASAIVRAEQAKPLSANEKAYVDRELDRLSGVLERHGIPAAELRARVKGAERPAGALSNAELAAKFRQLSQEERLRTAGLKGPAAALEKVNTKIDQTYPPGSPQNATARAMALDTVVRRIEQGQRFDQSQAGKASMAATKGDSLQGANRAPTRERGYER